MIPLNICSGVVFLLGVVPKLFWGTHSKSPGYNIVGWDLFIYLLSQSLFLFKTAWESLKCPKPQGYLSWIWYYSQVVTVGLFIAKASEGSWAIIQLKICSCILVSGEVWCASYKSINPVMKKSNAGNNHCLSKGERCIIREPSRKAGRLLPRKSAAV